MPFYKDLNGGIHYLDSADFEYLLPAGCESITDVQAKESIAPTPREVLVSAAQTALSAGLAVESASTPGINGTFSCDRLSQMDIIAIETSLNAGKGFPGGASTFKYPSVDGSMHAFNAADFSNFAAAIRDYVYALNSVISGASTALPESSITIA
jgi:hypothetical protein